jgi:hypothetical protein
MQLPDYPAMILGKQIITAVPVVTANVSLSEDCTVSNQFRSDFNEWLKDEFGFTVTNMIEDGAVIVTEHAILMNAATRKHFNQWAESQNQPSITIPATKY